VPAPATVLVDGRAVKSCNVLAAQMHGSSESPPSRNHAGRRLDAPDAGAFKACHGLQCGFCTPGMVMSAIDSSPTTRTAANARSARAEGNFCRCTGYQNIVKAIAQGAKAMGV